MHLSYPVLSILILLSTYLIPLSANFIEDDGDTDQIVGGSQAKPGSYPFYVKLIIGSLICIIKPHLILFDSFQAVFTRNGDAVCGGSLITPSHVLTAAHCVD